LSEKFSNLPGLHLRIGRSALGQVLFACFCLGCVYTGCLLLADGYLLLGGGLLLVYGWVLWPLRRQSLAGAVIIWVEGQWYIERSGERRAIEISARSVCLPWFICLAWQELPRGPAGYLWLYADSAPRDQLRSLRVRLRLQG
jgi:hypothetical protein